MGVSPTEKKTARYRKLQRSLNRKNRNGVAGQPARRCSLKKKAATWDSTRETENASVDGTAEEPARRILGPHAPPLSPN